jgi:hypothetical protein
LVLLSTPADGNRFGVTVRKILDARKVKEGGLAGRLQPGATFRIKQTWELASRNGCSRRNPTVAPSTAFCRISLVPGAVFGTEFFAQRKERREIEGIRVALAVEARGLMDTMIATHAALVDMLSIHETSAIRSVGAVPAAELERARAAEKAVRSIGRSLARLRMPVVYPACADRIGTLGRRLAEDVARFYANYEHLQFLGGVVFQDASTTLELAQYAAAFEDVCLKALPLFEELPIKGMREPLDLDSLKAKVEGMVKART